MAKLKKDLGKQEQGELTRKNIIRISRKLFGRKTYAATSTEDILEELQLTRGALYHHFKSKKDIFYEVCLQMNEELSLDIKNSDWSKFKKEWHTSLDLAEDKEFIQIWLMDCYSVLTWEEIIDLDDRFIIKPLLELLKKSHNQKKIFVPNFEEVAHLFLGMVNQALLVISKCSQKEKAIKKKNFKLAIGNWLESLEVK